MWLLVIATNKVLVVHSFHKEESVARQWAECKSHDGEDVLIVKVPPDVLADLVAGQE